MDDKQLMNGLRGLALAEPRLGFDPGEVATTAAKKIRNRRATIGVGLATLAVLGSAVTFLGPGGVQSSTQVAGPASSGDPQLERNFRHLREVLPGLLPGATDITVPELEPDQHAGMMTAVVQFHDDAGPASFNVTITNPAGRAHMKAPGDICDPAKTDEGSDSKSSRCELVPQGDGGKVVLSQSGSVAVTPDNVPVITRFMAFNYRADGGYVGINNDNVVSATLAERYDFKDEEGFYKSFRSRPPLAEQQLMQLVTDPAFTLK